MKTKIKNINQLCTVDAMIRANRKASRELEIEMFGKPICHKKVQKSKKTYDRSKYKCFE